MSERAGDWLQTFLGIAFFPLDPRPEEVEIEDIAHALSMAPRFAGHTRGPYSIAQHSILVSKKCDPKDALWGLLHDASEAYLVDIPSPIKRLPEMVWYRDAEKRVQRAICERFGLPTEMPESVHEADVRMLRTEVRDLMNPPKKDWSEWFQGLTPYETKIVPCGNHSIVKNAFMDRFKTLRRLHEESLA